MTSETAQAQGGTENVPSHAARARDDLIRGAHMWYLWGLLGWQDIRQRYRRSKLGPFWLTISMGVMVVSLGFLYAHLFKLEVGEYLPFISLGFIVWGMISGLTTEGCNAFIMAGGIIKHVSLPLSVHVYRVVWSNLIILAHNAVIFAVILVIFPIWPGWTGLLAIPGLILLCLNGVWVTLLFGLVSARFRDVPQTIASVVQVAFFVTPIIWKPELLAGRALVLDLNPFYHLVHVIRAPLLGEVPGLLSWAVAAGLAVTGWALTFAVYSRFRRRVAYWV